VRKKSNESARAISATHTTQTHQASREAVRALIPPTFERVALPIMSQHHFTALPSQRCHAKNYETKRLALANPNAFLRRLRATKSA
jgi:hypothetical protein